MVNLYVQGLYEVHSQKYGQEGAGFVRAGMWLLKIWRNTVRAHTFHTETVPTAKEQDKATRQVYSNINQQSSLEKY